MAFGAVVLGALLAAGEPAPYGVSELLVLLGLALVVPGLDRARAAVATSGCAVAVVGVRLLIGGLGPADAWSGGATVVAALALAGRLARALRADFVHIEVAERVRDDAERSAELMGALAGAVQDAAASR